MTQRKSQKTGIFSNFWNEFLFAREFEYETPLTPVEIADALQTIEEREHKQYFLSLFNLRHRFYYDSDSDKSGDFQIEVEPSTRGKWWELDSAMMDSSGTIEANSETGLTTVKGKTQFNRQYYIWMLIIFAPNFYFQASMGNLGVQVFWLVFTMIFWYVMYSERNKLADQIDDIIMNAKSEQSMSHLVDADEDKLDNVQIEETQGYILG